MNHMAGWACGFNHNPEGNQPDHYPRSVTRRSKRRATRSARDHRRESSPWRVLLSAAGKTDFIHFRKNLPIGTYQVDMIKFSGPLFQNVDNRLMSLQLVSQGLTDAVMFKADGETVQPAEVFYKKAILVERGVFDLSRTPPTTCWMARDAFF